MGRLACWTKEDVIEAYSRIAREGVWATLVFAANVLRWKTFVTVFEFEVSVDEGGRDLDVCS